LAAATEQLVDLVAGGVDRRAVAHLRVEPRRPARGLGSDNAAEDQTLGERVAAEAVGAVHARRTLADRVEAFDVGRVRLTLDQDAAHRVVSGRRHVHRGRGDVEHRQVDELAIHARQPLEDQIAVEVGNVEQHASVLGSASLGDLGVVRQRHPVAGGELEPLGIVVRHEAVAVGVPQDSALAAYRLGHQRAGGLFWVDHPGGVELDQLHVAQPAPRLRSQPHRVARVLVAAGG
jgi:hypothetical protein